MPRQFPFGRQLVGLLEEGKEPREAVKQLGVTLHDGAGATQQALARQDRQAMLALTRLQRELLVAKAMPLALQCLQLLMRNEEAPAVARLKAALALLEYTRGETPTSAAKQDTEEVIKPEEIPGMIEMLQAMHEEHEKGKATVQEPEEVEQELENLKES